MESEKLTDEGDGSYETRIHRRIDWVKEQVQAYKFIVESSLRIRSVTERRLDKINITVVGVEFMNQGKWGNKTEKKGIENGGTVYEIVNIQIIQISNNR